MEIRKVDPSQNSGGVINFQRLWTCILTLGKGYYTYFYPKLKRSVLYYFKSFDILSFTLAQLRR